MAQCDKLFTANETSPQCSRRCIVCVADKLVEDKVNVFFHFISFPEHKYSKFTRFGHNFRISHYLFASPFSLSFPPAYHTPHERCAHRILMPRTTHSFAHAKQHVFSVSFAYSSTQNITIQRGTHKNVQHMFCVCVYFVGASWGVCTE